MIFLPKLLLDFLRFFNFFTRILKRLFFLISRNSFGYSAKSSFWGCHRISFLSAFKSFFFSRISSGLFPKNLQSFFFWYFASVFLGLTHRFLHEFLDNSCKCSLIFNMSKRISFCVSSNSSFWEFIRSYFWETSRSPFCKISKRCFFLGVLLVFFIDISRSYLVASENPPGVDWYFWFLSMRILRNLLLGMQQEFYQEIV